MASTLTEMRSLVRQLLDDENTDTEENRWADAELDFALEAALEHVLYRLGPQTSRLDSLQEVTTSSGAASLSSYDPLLIKGVEYKFGNVFVPLEQGDHRSPTVEGSDATLRITYVGRPTFPSSGGSNMTYGNTNAPLKMIDRAVAIRAALDILPKDGERNAGLEQQERKAWDALKEISHGPRAADLVPVAGAFIQETTYFSGQQACYRWAYVDGSQSLKLVY